jgi:hypothetical protein
MKPYDDKAIFDTQTSRMKLITLTWTRSDVDVEEERRGSKREAKGKLNIHVHGSVHLGDAYIRLKVQRDAHRFVCTCILYFTMFALYVSGAIYTLHQEDKLQSTAVGMHNYYGM